MNGPVILIINLNLHYSTGPQLKKSIQPAVAVSQIDQFPGRLAPKTVSSEGVPNKSELAPSTRIIGKKDIIPLPSSLKLLKATPIIESVIQSNALSNGK